MTAPSMRSTQRPARSWRPSLVLLDSHRQQWRMEWFIRKRRSPVSFSRLASTRAKLVRPTRHEAMLRAYALKYLATIVPLARDR